MTKCRNFLNHVTCFELACSTRVFPQKSPNRNPSWRVLKISDPKRNSGREIEIALSNSFSVPDRAHFTVPFKFQIGEHVKLDRFVLLHIVCVFGSAIFKTFPRRFFVQPLAYHREPLKTPSTQRGIHSFQANTPSTASIFFSSCSSRPSSSKQRWNGGCSSTACMTVSFGQQLKNKRCKALF